MFDVEGNMGLSDISEYYRYFWPLSNIVKYCLILLNIVDIVDYFLKYFQMIMKHSRPLIHNHVPVFSYNGMIGSVLVKIFDFQFYFHENYKFRVTIYVFNLTFLSQEVVDLLICWPIKENITIKLNVNNLTSWIVQHKINIW